MGAICEYVSAKELDDRVQVFFERAKALSEKDGGAAKPPPL
jgi:hypothetical protein